MSLSIKNNLGVEVKKVSTFSFSETDMGEAFITLDVKFPADVSPGFALTWYVTFKGEDFCLSTLKPPATKDTSSLQYTYSLTFKSERENLRRYMFQDFAEMPVGNTALVPQSDDFAFYGNLTQFVDRFNLNLEYWFGAGVWDMVINTEYIPSAEPVLIACSKITLWDLLREVWNLFGVRWNIASVGGVMTINVAYEAEEVEHIFEYGKVDLSNNEKGLIEVTRSNPLNDIYTRLSGRGATRNIPSTYFKSGDPDENSSLEFVYIPNLLPKNYRQYMKGWNQSEDSGERLSGQTEAWYKGYDDEAADLKINPIDYVESDNKDVYGLWCGSLEPNEDIYPTLQGATDVVLGRLDEVIAVEVVTNDDYEDSQTSASQEPDSVEDTPMVSTEGMVAFGADGVVSVFTDVFTVKDGRSEISFAFSSGVNVIDKGWGSHVIGPDSGYVISSTVKLYDASDDSVVDTKYFWVAYSGVGAFTDMGAGSYYMELILNVSNTVTINEINYSGASVPTDYNISVTASLGSVKIYEYVEGAEGAYKQTFDIWIKNVWGSAKGIGESDEDYMERVWSPLVTTSDMTVMWSDGMLAGGDYEFKVAKINGVWQIFHDTSVIFGGISSEWRLTLIKSDSELEASNRQIPNIFQNAVPGNHFFFININMPYDPYVYDAELRLQSWMEAELAKADGEFPTFSVRPSKIFMDSFTEVDKLRAGNTVRLRDVRLIGESYITQHIASLVLTFNEASILPEWEMTITDEVNVDTNPIRLLQGEVRGLTSGALSSAQQIQEATRAMSRTFLRKDGVSDTSYSPTTFNENIKVGKNLVSKDFIQGDFGGTGMGFYRDVNGNTVLEVDKAVVRREMRVNELLINQVTFTGGKQVFSAAGVEVTAVEDITGAFRLYFDNKNGTKQNQFAVNDQAYCQRFDPGTNAVIKYYWSLVTAVGVDYIEISKTDSDGTGRPGEGDQVAQMGNRSNIARQSCLIIDQLNGGSVVQYAGISGYSLTNKNYVGFGVNPSTGKAYNYTYGETFIGDRDITDPDATYITFQQKEGDAAPKVHIKADISIGAGSSGLTNLSEWEDVEDALGSLQSQIDGQIIAWFQEHDPTLANYPTNEWTTDELKDQHLNDTFTNLSTGGSWRFAKAWDTYSWVVISDTATQQALIAAGLAQDTADGKKRVFTTTPTTPYDVGDLWSGLNSGDLKVCTTARAAGSYEAGDWELASKYTDDTTANAAATAASNAQTSANTANGLLSDIASDSKLTPVEKQSVKLEWDVIVAEKSKIDGQADYYGVSKTAYGSAYSTLNAYISPLLADLGATSNITGTTFRSNFAAYYAARQDVLDAIAEAAKDLGDLANANAIAAALVGNPNLIKDGYRLFNSTTNVSAIQTQTIELVYGRTYTFSVKGSRVDSNKIAIVFIDRTIAGGSRWVRELWMPIAGVADINSLSFICPETGTYNVGFWFQSSSLNVVDFVMLQEGSVYIDDNTQFKQTDEEDVSNKENLLENSVTRSITAGGSDNYSSIPLAIKSYYSSFPSAQILLLNNAIYTITINNSTLSSGTVYSIRLFCIETWSFTGSPLVIDNAPVGRRCSYTFRVPSTNNWVLNIYAGVFGATAGKTITLSNIMLQKGPFSTPWKPCLKALTEAMQGSTEITGGLILSNLIMLKNAIGNVLAGLSGMDDNITLWGGGTHAQALTAVGGGTPLPVLLSKSGAGSNIGCLKVVDKDTVQINNGAFVVLLTTKTIAQVSASLETVT